MNDNDVSKDEKTTESLVSKNKKLIQLLVELLHNSNLDSEQISTIMSSYVDPIRIMISKGKDDEDILQIFEWRRDFLNKTWNDAILHQKDDSVIDKVKRFLTNT